MSTTHVAGPAVQFTKLDRAIQRCAVCGEKLIDVRPSRMAVPDGQDASVSFFGEARMIRISGDNPVHSEDVGCFVHDPLPDDFCLALVED